MLKYKIGNNIPISHRIGQLNSIASQYPYPTFCKTQVLLRIYTFQIEYQSINLFNIFENNVDPKSGTAGFPFSPLGKAIFKNNSSKTTQPSDL